MLRVASVFFFLLNSLFWTCWSDSCFNHSYGLHRQETELYYCLSNMIWLLGFYVWSSYVCVFTDWLSVILLCLPSLDCCRVRPKEGKLFQGDWNCVRRCGMIFSISPWKWFPTIFLVYMLFKHIICHSFIWAWAWFIPHFFTHYFLLCCVLVGILFVMKDSFDIFLWCISWIKALDGLQLEISVERKQISFFLSFYVKVCFHLF